MFWIRSKFIGTIQPGFIIIVSTGIKNYTMKQFYKGMLRNYKKRRKIASFFFFNTVSLYCLSVLLSKLLVQELVQCLCRRFCHAFGGGKLLYRCFF